MKQEYIYSVAVFSIGGNFTDPEFIKKFTSREEAEQFSRNELYCGFDVIINDTSNNTSEKYSSEIYLKALKDNNDNLPQGGNITEPCKKQEEYERD